MPLLTRQRNLPIQPLQGLMHRRPIRFEVYGFDLEVLAEAADFADGGASKSMLC